MQRRHRPWRFTARQVWTLNTANLCLTGLVAVVLLFDPQGPARVTMAVLLMLSTAANIVITAQGRPEVGLEAHVRTDGRAPSLRSSGVALLGLNLGQQLHHAEALLGPPTSAFSYPSGHGREEVHREWAIGGGLAFSADFDKADVICEMHLGRAGAEGSADARAWIPGGLLLGQATVRDVVTALGNTTTTTLWTPENQAIYDLWYRTGPEATVWFAHIFGLSLHGSR